MKELVKIQSELKAPKNLFNKFGGYYYRSAEDILEALKPLLVKYNCLLTLTDEVVLIGNRFYVRACATLKNAEGSAVSVTAYAREEEAKKGMDGSQITGAASSYARKYALNGLFLIDDQKDADATHTHGNGNVSVEQENEKINEKITKEEIMNAKTLDELRMIWQGLSEEGKQLYKNEIKKRKEELTKNIKNKES